VAAALARLSKAGLEPRVVVDASHGNSGKDHTRQPEVAADVAARLAAGDRTLVGLMVESFLVAGRQELTLGQAEALTYGQSVTDACIAWDTTVAVLEGLAGATASRRGGLGRPDSP
jgi:3-deoxy-7-phosphoheptulonate synthase